MSRHLTAQVASSAELPVPATNRAPFTWQTTTITSADKAPLVLKWPNLSSEVLPTHLRIAVGLDERDEKVVEIFLPKSGRVLGTLELRFASQFQLYPFALTPGDVADIRTEGVALRMIKGSDLEILTGGEGAPVELLQTPPSRLLKKIGYEITKF